MRAPRLLPLVLAAVLAACTTTPDATELPGDDRRIERGEPGSVPDAEPAGPDPDGVAYQPLRLDGVRGGEATFRVPGDPESVVEMLLDFDHAAGRRAWAKRYVVLERSGGRTLTRWGFEGPMGMDPVVELEFVTARDAAGITVTYRLVKPDFGLQAFFGDYRVEAAGEGESLLTERVFIDSGVWIANASAKDIEEGLREDARLIREWMSERSESSDLDGADPASSAATSRPGASPPTE